MLKVYIKKPNETTTDIKTTDDIANKIYAPRKKASLKIAYLYRDVFGDDIDDENSRAYRMRKCYDYYTQATPVSKSTGELHLAHTRIIKACNCRIRFCPVCAYRQMRKTSSNLYRVMNALLDKNKRFVFITLTVPNCVPEALKEYLSILSSSITRFTRRAELKKSFLGYFKSFEVTWNSQKNSYHPHYHLLACVDDDYFTGEKYLKNETISEIWTSCVFDELRSRNSKLNNKQPVEMSTAFLGEKNFFTSMNAFLNENDDFHKSIRELSKYVCKPENINEKTLSVLDVALKGKHNFDYHGIMKDVYDELCLNENLLDSDKPDTEETIWVKVNYAYNVNNSCYAQTISEMTDKLDDKIDVSDIKQKAEAEFGKASFIVLDNNSVHKEKAYRSYLYREKVKHDNKRAKWYGYARKGDYYEDELPF